MSFFFDICFVIGGLNVCVLCSVCDMCVHDFH